MHARLFLLLGLIVIGCITASAEKLGWNTLIMEVAGEKTTIDIDPSLKIRFSPGEILLSSSTNQISISLPEIFSITKGSGYIASPESSVSDVNICSDFRIIGNTIHAHSYHQTEMIIISMDGTIVARRSFQGEIEFDLGILASDSKVYIIKVGHKSLKVNLTSTN
ncbi:MAG: hypothetical protein HDS67_00180 [Bacteroidales bacterium]|nr:hypothetical protein [Bacteroidales bacterium]